MASCRSNADYSKIRRRKNYKFKGIKCSEPFKALNSLPPLTPSQHLTQDAIFKVVGEEIKQVKLDIATINEIVLEDIRTESSQTDQINRQLKSSLKKIDHSYSRTLKLRERYDHEIEEQTNALTSRLEFVETSLFSLKNNTSQIIDSILRIDSELPTKNRSINEQLFNQKHYPLLFQCIHDKYPKVKKNKNALVTLDATGEELVDNPCLANTKLSPSLHSGNSPATLDTAHELIEPPESLDSKEVKEIESLISNYNIAKQRKVHVPPIILMPKFQRVSNPSVSTSLDQVELKRPFSAKKDGN